MYLRFELKTEAGSGNYERERDFVFFYVAGMWIRNENRAEYMISILSSPHNFFYYPAQNYKLAETGVLFVYLCQIRTAGRLTCSPDSFLPDDFALHCSRAGLCSQAMPGLK